MKKIILIITGAFLVASSALAQVTPDSLMGLGMPGALATQVASIGTGSAVIPNDTAFRFRNFANSADINVLKVTTSNQTVIDADDTGGLGLRVGGQTKWSTNNAGLFQNDATVGSDIRFNRSGSTITLQEATPASACMGAATPNGNTNVVVTTSCAVSGARVFYTRAGAVTNMASISTTAAPSGTGFSFASTGATDTLASSVVWFIVKEAP